MIAGTLTRSTNRRDAVLLALAVLVTTGGLVLGWNAVVLSIAVALLPAVGFLAAGHIPGRAGASGCIAMALAATLIRPTGPILPWGDLALMAGMGVVACYGASRAGLLSGEKGLSPAAAPPEGRWVTIVIDCDDPSDSAGCTANPKVSPHPTPERRSLGRVVGDRRRGRRPALMR